MFSHSFGHSVIYLVIHLVIHLVIYLVIHLVIHSLIVHLSITIIQVAQERGIHFEIAIGPGLRSATNAKQSLISYARKIITATKGKNVILSVGALKCGEVRGPYDLMNLGVMFGMNQSQAKDAVTK